jgi:hypothetical protein
MANHAILITFRDMDKKLSEFIAKAKKKYGRNFRKLYFDDGFEMETSLYDSISDIHEEDKLKIFIAGEGDTGTQYIGSANKLQKKTVDNLATLLADALGTRAKYKKDSDKTEVNMVSCLFGRTTNGLLDERCPAVRLHRALTAKKIYVDLVARTESINTRYGGRRLTASVPDLKLVAPSSSDIPSLLHAKTQFSKIRCTYQESGGPVVLLRDYESEETPYINSQGSQGKRIVWADYVVNELVKYITPTGGETEVTDDRRKQVFATVKTYDSERDPVRFKERLERLKTDIGTHRKKLHWPGLPRTAKLITKLLEQYPG